MYLFTSACSWFAAATASSSMIATARMARAECVTVVGRRDCSTPGKGRVPSTESTTIFSGTGLSRAMGLASSPMPKSRATWIQYGRAWRRSRRYNAKSPTGCAPMHLRDRRTDRRHGGHTLLDDVQRGQRRAEAEQPGGRPEVRLSGGGGERREDEREDGPAPGDLGPPPHPDELLPAGVILDAHDQPRHAQDPAAHFEVPVVQDRKSTRLNSSHPSISYAVFCLKKKKHPESPSLAIVRSERSTVLLVPFGVRNSDRSST